MSEVSTGFEADLRPSGKPLQFVMACVGATIVFLANPLAPGSEQLLQAGLGLLVIALAVTGWRLEARELPSGRWIVVITLVGLLVWAGDKWGADVICPLLAVPVFVSAALIGVGAARMTAIVTSVCLITVAMIGDLSPALMMSTLAAMWTVLVLWDSAIRAVSGVAVWSWEFFERARSLLEEARESQLELGLALADLANA
ncbi:unnamed protein product, partial [marine sediment metagenome]